LNEIEHAIGDTNEVGFLPRKAEEQLTLLLEGQGWTRASDGKYLIFLSRIPKAICHEGRQILLADGFTSDLRAITKHHEGSAAFHAFHLTQQGLEECRWSYDGVGHLLAFFAQLFLRL